jgi:hypothetical protein
LLLAHRISTWKLANPDFLGISPKKFGDHLWASDTRCWNSVGNIPAQITRCWVQAMVGALISRNLKISAETSEINLGEISEIGRDSFEILSRFRRVSPLNFEIQFFNIFFCNRAFF